MMPDLGMMLTALAALATVLGLIVLAGWLARRGGFAPKPPVGRELAVQAAFALDARRRLHLVQCGDRRVLLLTGGPQDLVVGWLEPSSGGNRPADPDARS